jgi:hypothetical protein
MKGQQLLHLGRRHGQLGGSDLRQVSLEAVPVQWDDRVAAGGQDHPQLRWWMHQHRVQGADDVGVAEDMDVVEH